ncbi:MAG TPA: DUF1203 domain-containing protein [Ideonella sp.]|nr:DUF1203 domain-containing protein [Ideonella sp.]
MSESGERERPAGRTMGHLESAERIVHHFQLTGLGHAFFEPLFELSDEALSRMGAQRRIANEHPGFPCRISLEDAPEGAEMLLLPFVHQPAASPYHASGPIFVRRGVKQRVLGVGELPAYVTRRLMSVRAYDAAHMIVDAAVCEGGAVRAEIERMFDNAQVAYLHLHNAKRGCYSCRVDRA